MPLGTGVRRGSASGCGEPVDSAPHVTKPLTGRGPHDDGAVLLLQEFFGDHDNSELGGYRVEGTPDLRFLTLDVRCSLP
jgi:hypothetical protein